MEPAAATVISTLGEVFVCLFVLDLGKEHGGFCATKITEIHGRFEDMMYLLTEPYLMEFLKKMRNARETAGRHKSKGVYGLRVSKLFTERSDGRGGSQAPRCDCTWTNSVDGSGAGAGGIAIGLKGNFLLSHFRLAIPVRHVPRMITRSLEFPLLVITYPFLSGATMQNSCRSFIPIVCRETTGPRARSEHYCFDYTWLLSPLSPING